MGNTIPDYRGTHKERWKPYRAWKIRHSSEGSRKVFSTESESTTRRNSDTYLSQLSKNKNKKGRTGRDTWRGTATSTEKEICGSETLGRSSSERRSTSLYRRPSWTSFRERMVAKSSQKDKSRDASYSGGKENQNFIPLEEESIEAGFIQKKSNSDIVNSNIDELGVSVSESFKETSYFVSDERRDSVIKNENISTFKRPEDRPSSLFIKPYYQSRSTNMENRPCLIPPDAKYPSKIPENSSFSPSKEKWGKSIWDYKNENKTPDNNKHDYFSNWNHNSNSRYSPPPAVKSLWGTQICSQGQNNPVAHSLNPYTTFSQGNRYSRTPSPKPKRMSREGSPSLIKRPYSSNSHRDRSSWAGPSILPQERLSFIGGISGPSSLPIENTRPLSRLSCRSSVADNATLKYIELSDDKKTVKLSYHTDSCREKLGSIGSINKYEGDEFQTSPNERHYTKEFRLSPSESKPRIRKRSTSGESPAEHHIDHIQSKFYSNSPKNSPVIIRKVKYKSGSSAERRFHSRIDEKNQLSSPVDTKDRRYIISESPTSLKLKWRHNFFEGEKHQASPIEIRDERLQSIFDEIRDERGRTESLLETKRYSRLIDNFDVSDKRLRSLSSSESREDRKSRSHYYSKDRHHRHSCSDSKEKRYRRSVRISRTSSPTEGKSNKQKENLVDSFSSRSHTPSPSAIPRRNLRTNETGHTSPLTYDSSGIVSPTNSPKLQKPLDSPRNRIYHGSPRNSIRTRPKIYDESSEIYRNIRDNHPEEYSRRYHLSRADPQLQSFGKYDMKRRPVSDDASYQERSFYDNCIEEKHDRPKSLLMGTRYGLVGSLPRLVQSPVAATHP